MANMITDALSGILSKSIMPSVRMNSNVVGNALGVFKTLKGNPNPMSALRSMASSNPQISKALEIMDQNGGDPKAAFMKLAEQSGINPNDILNLIK